MLHNVPCLDTLRLSQADYYALIVKLEKTRRRPVGIEQRSSPRYPYLLAEPLLLQLEGALVAFLVRPMDLSSNGMRLLHGGFLYPDTPCTISLLTIDGESAAASGSVTRCQCLHGRIHEVGIQFSERIQVENFIALETRAASAPPPAPEPADVATRLAELQQLVEAHAPHADLAAALQRLLPALGAAASSGGNGATNPSETPKGNGSVNAPDATAAPTAPGASRPPAPAATPPQTATPGARSRT